MMGRTVLLLYVLISGNSQSCRMLKKCCSDICNANETSIFYFAMLDASLSRKCAAVSGSKKVVECVAVSCCLEMSETN
jgi:hypothetical protein